MVAATTVSALYTRARGKIQGWQRSPSHEAIARVEEAAARGDAELVGQLGDTQRERQLSLQRDVAAARASGAKRLPDGTSIKDAAREVDFMGLAIARSVLHESATSQNAGQRMGRRTVAGWTKGIDELDRTAQSTDFEGHLALELRALGAELDHEARAADELDTAIEAYRSHVPRVFGGDMKRDHQSTAALLERFRTDEIGHERALHERATGTMRGRVTTRLIHRDGTFAKRHARLGRLSELEVATGEAAALAEEIDSELASAISHRSQEQTYLAIAASKTAVPVTKTRTGSDGKLETYTDIEDQSGTWKSMAWSEASAAESAGRRAADGLDRLRPLVESLHGNATVRAEELVDELPAPSRLRVRTGDSLMTLVGSPLLNLLTGDGSNVRQVRDAFRTDVVRLQRVHEVTGKRRHVEHTWVDAKVTEDVDRQVAEVSQR